MANKKQEGTSDMLPFLTTFNSIKIKYIQTHSQSTDICSPQLLSLEGIKCTYIILSPNTENRYIIMANMHNKQKK